MTTVAIEDFDPGVGVADRWWKAFDAAEKSPAVTRILFGEATYAFTKRLVLPRRLALIGTSAEETRLLFSTVGDAGIWVQKAAAFSSFASMAVVSTNPFDGADIGILVNGPRVRFNEIRIQNWSANGIRFQASVPVGNANNCRGSDVQFDFCGHGEVKLGGYVIGPDDPDYDPQTPKRKQNPTHCAVYMQGGDANGCKFRGWEAYDCREGFFDNSFLGNTWDGCSGEGCTNKFDKPTDPPTPTVGTSFRTLDANCRSTFTGCYAESDSPARVLFPSVIIGGYVGNIGNAVQIGPHGGVGEFGAQHVYSDPDEPNAPDTKLLINTLLGGNQDGDALSLQVLRVTNGVADNVYLRHVLRWAKSVAGWWSFNYANLNLTDTFRFREHTFWVPFDSQHGLPAEAYGMRRAVRVSLAAVGAPQDGGSWRVGDRLDITDVSPGSPCSFVFCSDNTWKPTASVAS